MQTNDWEAPSIRPLEFNRLNKFGQRRMQPRGAGHDRRCGRRDPGRALRLAAVRHLRGPAAGQCPPAAPGLRLPRGGPHPRLVLQDQLQRRRVQRPAPGGFLGRGGVALRVREGAPPGRPRRAHPVQRAAQAAGHPGARPGRGGAPARRPLRRVGDHRGHRPAPWEPGGGGAAPELRHRFHRALESFRLQPGVRPGPGGHRPGQGQPPP